MSDNPVFTKRKRNSYQVRFWSQKELYAKFSETVEFQELLICDVFNDFMKWFIETNQIKTVTCNMTLVAVDEEKLNEVLKNCL